MALRFIPDVDLLEAINGRDLIRLCQTNRYYRDLCRHDSVWKHKLHQDYPTYVGLKPDTMSFRRYYLLLDASTPVTIASIDDVDYLPSLLVTWEEITTLLYQRYYRYGAILMQGNRIIGSMTNHESSDDSAEILRQADLIVIITDQQYDRGVCQHMNSDELVEYLENRGIIFDDPDDLRIHLGESDLCSLIQILTNLGRLPE